MSLCQICLYGKVIYFLHPDKLQIEHNIEKNAYNDACLQRERTSVR